METEDLIKKHLPVTFSGNHKLNLKLQPPFFSRKYGYLQIFKNQDEENAIKYELEIKYIKTVSQDIRIFRLERLTEVFINNVVPDLLVDQLAYECGKVFYPLDVKVGFNGQFAGIYNEQEIIERWKEVKERVKKYFLGDLVTRYIELMDVTINSSELLADSFRNDLLFRAYFNDIYKSYTPDLQIQEDVFFPVAAKGNQVSFETSQLVKPLLNDYEEIEIIHKGTVNDKRTKFNIENGYHFILEGQGARTISGTYNATYKLAANTKSIESIVAKWVLEEPINKSIEIRLFRIDEEKDSDNLMSEEQQGSSLVFLDGNNSQKSENSITRIISSFFKK
ncbi:hypothetical protein HDE68_002158 [Pedobacter cryoconitis]|uniref:Uncharacterized protein n=1 Tax=Pedobacter cryoconitis TaxID=188932 RepID=A0A7W8ZLY5_9SPHI|nr:hypothetical protein [Pedobacter cryoconitis]MBB5636270.1 hypothetical protein [Pedobacter cryoconitis]